MMEDGSLWGKMRRYVGPDYVVACLQVSHFLRFVRRASSPGGRGGSFAWFVQYLGICSVTCEALDCPCMSRAPFVVQKNVDPSQHVVFVTTYVKAVIQ